MSRKKLLFIMGLVAAAVLCLGLVVSRSAREKRIASGENVTTLKEAVAASFEEKEETSKPAATPRPAVKEKKKEEKNEVPEATPSPASAPSPAPSPLVTPIPLPSLKPVETLPPRESTAPVQASSGGPSPKITITDVKYPPKSIVENSVADIKGVVSCDCGILTSVKGQLVSGDQICQSCLFFPDSQTFSLAGTVNSDLHFAHLTPGNYIYKIIARADNAGAETEEVLFEYEFEVTKRAAESYIADNGEDRIYSAKKTSDTDNAGIIWNYLIDRFGNPCAAAGIMANIKAESSYNPDAGNSSFISINNYGLCQWTNERKAALKTFADEKGVSPSDINVQLDFMMHELDTSYTSLKTDLLNATSGYNAAIEFCVKYEQSASTENRGSTAKELLEKYAK